MRESAAEHEKKRLDRQIDLLSRALPFIRRPLGSVRPGGRFSFLRIPAGILFIAGGVFSILPGLGIWMLPLGLLLLAFDLPFLRRPMSGFTIRARRAMARARKKFRSYQGSGA